MTKIHKTLAARFAANVQKVQRDREIDDAEMAKILKVSRMYVNYLRRAERTPSLEMVETIARRLGFKDAIDMLREP